MQKMGMSSTSFCNSTFLFTSLHYGICGSCHYTNGKNSFSVTKTLLSSSLPPLTRLTHFSSFSVPPNLDFKKLGVSAFKKGRKGGSTLFEMDGFADEDGGEDEFFDFDDGLDAGDDDDEEGVFLPFGKMKKWLENKPRGFGEGKVYDTSVEDKLLEEIEQSRQSQFVNVNNLKSNPVNSGSKKDDQQNKKDVPSGIRVRVVNLPKKKNVHRDLKAAFDGVSGIINISPAVSGNKKTKDPICKGFAFVDFENEVDAIRFVQNFSGHTITFGKVQKQIKCEVMNSSLSNNLAHQEMRDNDSRIAEPAVSGLIDSPNVDDFDLIISFSDLSLEGVSDEFDDQDDEPDMISDGFDDQDDELDPVFDEFDDQDNELEFDDQDDEDDELDTVELGEDRDNFSAVGEPKSSSVDDIEQTLKHSADSTTSDRLARIRALEKKLLARGKQFRFPKEEKVQKQERTRGVVKKLPVRGNQQNVPKEKKVQKLDTVSEEFDDRDDELDTVELREDRDNLSAVGETKSSSFDDIEQTLEHSADSTTSDRLARIRALEKKILGRGKQFRVPKEEKGQKQERTTGVKKKPPVRGNQQRVPKEKKVQKLDIPGSAKRLQIKEKAVLTDVFSKYGLKTGLTSHKS